MSANSLKKTEYLIQIPQISNFKSDFSQPKDVTSQNPNRDTFIYHDPKVHIVSFGAANKASLFFRDFKRTDYSH